MLFAVAGSQGSGKSSVLRGLENSGYEVLQRKISRSILADWGVKLDEVNSDEELSIEFQKEVLLRKRSDEESAIHSSEIVFTERTFIDSFVYFMYTFGSKTKFDRNITDYYNTCVENDSHYSAVFLLPSGKFQPQNDGVRNTNSLYVESVDVVMQHFLRKTLNRKLYDVTAVSIEDRVKYVRDVTTKLI